MNKRFIYFKFLLMIFCFKNSSQECLCSGKKTGKYCGTDLNQINGNNECDRNMYYCGKSNRNKTAVLLKSCPNGSECDVKSFGRVTCLRRIDCRCDRVIGRGPHCGNQLQGLDCGPNIIFMCSLIGGPSPRDACPNGCNRGKCIIGVQNVNKTESDPEIVNSENVTEEQQKNPNSNVTQNPEIVNLDNVTEEQQKSLNTNATQNPELVNLDNVTEEQQKNSNANVTQNPELVNLDNVTEEQQKSLNTNVTQNPELVNSEDIKEEQQKSLNKNATQNPELVISDNVTEERQKSFNTNITRPTEETEP